MSETFARIVDLARAGEVRISVHGYEELAEDGLLASEVVDGLVEAVVIEDDPTYPKGAFVLVLQRDRLGSPIHVVWGIPRGQTSPAVLVTAYRPDPARWHEDFQRRRP